MTLSPYERAKQSILEEFEKFRSKIEPTEKEKISISASHNKMREILENSTEISVVESFLTGSYVRQTMIRPLKDVDFFVQMHYGTHKNDNSIQLLSKVRRVLSKAYPLTPIIITPPCIKVQFSYCHFEIVPAFAIEGNEDLFQIPANKVIGWQQTYPKIPDKWMTQENKKSEGLFIPTIKILKRWRDTYCRQLRSFHLEMLTRMAFDKYKIENYADGVWAFFARTSCLFDLDKNNPFVPEPGRDNVYVDQYLYDNTLMLVNVRRIIKTFFSVAQKAFNYTAKGQIGFAKQMWSKILGSSFYTPSTLPSPLSSLLMPPLSNPPTTTFPSFLSELLRKKNEE
ncbi:MAG: hypothetical protein WC947_01420 [Elusimicrobiota bacterium]